MFYENLQVFYENLQVFYENLQVFYGIHIGVLNTTMI